MKALSTRPSREELLLVKGKSLRKGVWIWTLSKIERGVVDLTLKCVERVRSPLLIQALNGVMAKLGRYLKSFLEMCEEAVRPLAETLINIAESWGNKDAWIWRFDQAYVRCLGLSSLSPEWG